MIVNLICVNYNTYDFLHRFLVSIEKAFLRIDRQMILNVFIADNSLQKKQITTNFSYNITLFDFENLGYFGAAFSVLSTCDKLSSSDFTIISNVDLVLPDDFFLKLINISFNKKTAWVAPRIFSLLDNTSKNYAIKKSRYSFLKIMMLYFSFKYSIIQKIYKVSLFYFKRKKSNCFYDKYVYCGHGSFIILTSVFFQVVPKESLKFQPFLYCEELFLGEIINMNHLFVEYCNELEVYDYEHASTKNLPKKEYYFLNEEALRFIIKRFY